MRDEGRFGDQVELLAVCVQHLAMSLSHIAGYVAVDRDHKLVVQIEEIRQEAEDVADFIQASRISSGGERAAET